MKRKWWISFFYSIIKPGLGQMYNGQLGKGLVFFAIYELFSITILTLLVFIPINRLISILFFGVIFLADILLSLEAALTSRRIEHQFSPRRYNRWFFYLGYYLIAAYLLSYPLTLFTTKYLVKAYKIPTGAMENSILVGDFLLGNHAIYRGNKSPQNGDIIVFKYPGGVERDYLKRCVAGSGQTVEIDKKDLIVDGKIEKPIETIKYINDGNILPLVTNFSRIKVPSKGDTIKTQDLPLREFLFLKHLIHQENPRSEVIVEFDLYIDSVLANDTPVYGMYTSPTGTKRPFCQIPFNNIDNWVYLSNIFECVEKEFANNHIEIQKNIYMDGQTVHKYAVKYDNYFVMGDNRDNSLDSRYWGFVNRNFVIAKGAVIYFSIKRDVPLWAFFKKVRWNRIGKPIK